ncbi:MAG: cytochrome c oxidase assembly protein [Steroidobacteraceae bacterium]
MRSILTYISPWDFSPTVLIACLVPAVLYVRGLRALGARGERVGCGAALAFLLALTLDYVVLQTYFDYLAQHMFWIHRLQHLVLHHLAPVLMVLATPGRVIEAGVPAGWLERGERLARDRKLLGVLRSTLRSAFRAVQNPVVAPLLFVGLIYFWLIPSIHFGAMLDIHRYDAMNWSMAVDGILFWWLMLGPRRAHGLVSIGYGARVVILFLIMLPQIAIGAYIALTRHLIYDVYAICGRAWAVSPITDQHLGGLLTWIPAAMMSVFAMLVILRRVLLAEAAAAALQARAPQPVD